MTNDMIKGKPIINLVNLFVTSYDSWSWKLYVVIKDNGELHVLNKTQSCIIIHILSYYSF